MALANCVAAEPKENLQPRGSGGGVGRGLSRSQCALVRQDRSAPPSEENNGAREQQSAEAWARRRLKSASLHLIGGARDTLARSQCQATLPLAVNALDISGCSSSEREAVRRSRMEPTVRARQRVGTAPRGGAPRPTSTCWPAKSPPIGSWAKRSLGRGSLDLGWRWSLCAAPEGARARPNAIKVASSERELALECAAGKRARD